MKNKKNIFIGTNILVSIILSTNIFAEQTTQATISNTIIPTLQLPKFSQILTTKQPATFSEPIPQSQQLYTIELPVNNEDETERKQNFTEALNQVITKNTADQKIIASQTIKSALSNPTAYIQRYTYINRNVTSNKPSLYLQIQFDKTAITQLLQQATTIPTEQLTDKQKTLVWLVKIEAFGKKTIQNESLNDETLTQLKKRVQDFGIPIIFPTLDLQDINLIKADDICNFNLTAIKKASQRYGTNNIIAVCIKQPMVNNAWSSQWLWLNDNYSEQFSFTENTLDDVITPVISAISKKIAKPINQTKKLVLRITNVKGLGQYNEVVRYLTTFDQVTQLDLVKISTEEVILNLNIIGDQQNLFTAINSQNKLVHNIKTTTLPTGVELDYKWVTTENEQPQAIDTKPLS